MKIKEINIIYTDMDAYRVVEIVMDDSTIFRVPTCACMRGCSGTANVATLKIGDEFSSEDELLDVIYPIARN